MSTGSMGNDKTESYVVRDGYSETTVSASSYEGAKEKADAYSCYPNVK